MNHSSRPLATNETAKEDPVTAVTRTATFCYFRPETEELIFLGSDEAQAFESHWRGMMICMDELHQAQAHYSSMLERYALTVETPMTLALEVEERLSAINEAERQEDKKRLAVKEKLGNLAEGGLGYEDVIELIPLAGKNRTQQRGLKRTPYAYVKKGYFTKTETRRKLHSVSLKPADKKGAQESILTRDKQGRVLVDTLKLAEQLKAVQWPTIKIELQDALDWAGSDLDLHALKHDYTLYDWAESWNNSLHGATALSANVDVSSAAQFMRFVSNVGASAEFDVTQGQGVLKGECKRTLTVASGYANLTSYLPDRIGWPLKLHWRNGQAVDLGMIRLCLEGQVSGFLGASLQLETQLQVMFKDDQQIISGQAGGRLPPFRERRARGREFFQAMEAQDQGVQLTAEKFSGGRVEGIGKGSVQWLKPTPPRGNTDDVSTILTTHAGEYVDFCSIGASIAGMAGLGAGGKFYCSFINGRFCFHVAASLCCGAGAKGGFIAEVSAKDIAEFGAWLVYQLYALDYGFFDLVDKDAFKAYSHYCVLQMIRGREAIYLTSDWLFQKSRDIADKLKKLIYEALEKTNDNLATSKQRNQLAKNIIELKDNLLRLPPESKAILLYLLTRHARMDHIDLGNRTWTGDIYSDRKEAIICILTSIQTVSEWHKVMCRMTADGSRIDRGHSATVSKEQEDFLVRFLQQGYNRDDDLREIKWEIEVIYNRLKTTIAWGHALAMNDTVFYLLNTYPNPHYPQGCQFGPCESADGRV
ncbi:MAG: hypothetical protein PW896_13540 [Pseudomonas sp.]|uniref:hypothetical protein n=1 Tax=Pseudomonas sp. TaxID=306 RepID=UPI00238D756D|nr:hypothetical protein [Pseudomonas sp.]MDE1196161.1 hypothetical protein [Pseudomonas sp.]